MENVARKKSRKQWKAQTLEALKSRGALSFYLMGSGHNWQGFNKKTWELDGLRKTVDENASWGLKPDWISLDPDVN